jgi:hypothetical protein
MLSCPEGVLEKGLLIEALLLVQHHCRRCQKAFCDNCSKDRVVLSNAEFGKEPQRVCHPCKVAERRFRLEGQGKRGESASCVQSSLTAITNEADVL